MKRTIKKSQLKRLVESILREGYEYNGGDYNGVGTRHWEHFPSLEDGMGYEDFMRKDNEEFDDWHNFSSERNKFYDDSMEKANATYNDRNILRRMRDSGNGMEAMHALNNDPNDILGNEFRNNPYFLYDAFDDDLNSGHTNESKKRRMVNAITESVIRRLRRR